jgi:hypothetical protein
MWSDRRVWANLAAIVLSSVASIFIGPLVEIIYPPTPEQAIGPAHTPDGEIRPGGAATPTNFARLRPGMGRDEVWSILGESAGLESYHEEWWHGPDSTIYVWYNSPGDRLTRGGEIDFRDGKRTAMAK